jgi:hypothetical protein
MAIAEHLNATYTICIFYGLLNVLFDESVA